MFMTWYIMHVETCKKLKNSKLKDEKDFYNLLLTMNGGLLG